MRHAFLAFTNPEDGVESTFNRWYDTFHVPEVLRYGRGFSGCRRFRLAREVRRGELPPWAYLALYTLEFDDLATLARSTWIEETPPLTPFTGLLKSDHVAWVYSPESARVVSRSAQAAERTVSHILLRWSVEGQVMDARQLEAVVERTEGCLAAQSYRLAIEQRANQQRSPWSTLVIYELTSGSSVQADSRDPAWLYAAISDFRRRDSLSSATP